MNIFNNALLTKQMWRLITNKDTLIHKCLKAKYFPKTSILKYKRKLMDICVCKNIHQTKDKILKGCCWRVGNGKDINAWKDSCLPYRIWFKVLSWKSNPRKRQQIYQS